MKNFFQTIQAGRLLRAAGILFLLTSPLLMAGCLMKTSCTGSLVPPTVDEDAALPGIPVTVAGHTRLIHYRTFGDPADPALLVMHGSLSDMRAYLPISVLSDRYFVVMWDQRGNGLSERVTAEELSPDAMVEEISAVKEAFSPERPVSIIGHSWSAVFAALYLARHPGDVVEAVLIEPFGLRSDFMEKADIPLRLMTEGYLDMMYSSRYLTPRDHETLDYRMLAVLRSGVRGYFCDNDRLPEWPVWRVGGYALIVWEKSLLSGTKYDYDFTAGLSDFQGRVLLVGSSCSPIGCRFQKRFHRPLFRHARVLMIDGSGHRILTEQPGQLITGLKMFLKRYKAA